MKKRTIIILSAVLIILLLAVYFYIGKPVVKPPERLANVPKQAEWVGGADGGSWYQVTKVVSKNTFRIKVYNEGNGELEIDTTFILNPDCSFKEIDSALLVKSIDGYDGEKVLLSLPEKGKRCSLIIK
ncbi:MAG: hypothetical protein JST47_16055 [Bacteroidetes bacterium]|nr:hypothetical protein [Bacteroidota bacterium]